MFELINIKHIALKDRKKMNTTLEESDRDKIDGEER